jgi:membrane-associated phospholipid phosphatase
VIVPTGLLLVFGVRSGRWQDADVSVREERKHFYHWAIPISAAGVVVMRLLNAPSYIQRGGLVTFGLFIVATLINRRLKISLHTLFAFYCTLVLYRMGLVPGTIALILAGLVFWSRLALRRHTVAENFAGVVAGALGGLIAGWWPR